LGQRRGFDDADDDDLSKDEFLERLRAIGRAQDDKDDQDDQGEPETETDKEVRVYASLRAYKGAYGTLDIRQPELERFVQEALLTSPQQAQDQTRERLFASARQTCGNVAWCESYAVAQAQRLRREALLEERCERLTPEQEAAFLARLKAL